MKKWPFILGLCFILFGVHIMAAVALVKSKKLQKTRFYRLAFFLIVSDACLMVEYAWYVIIFNNNDFYSDGVHQDQCLVLIHTIPAAIQSSLLMTILMCLQRLNATFRTPKLMLKILTNDFAIGFGFLLPHIYFLVRGVLEFSNNIQRLDFPCGAKYSTQKRYLLYGDIPNALYVAMIALCYLGVILRIVRDRRQVNVTANLSDLQRQQRKKAAMRMRYNMITLGCIIIVTAVSILPRTLYGIYANITETLNEDIIRT